MPDPIRTATLIKRWLSAHESSVSCDDCADHMDKLADVLAQHASPIGALREIELHISNCHCCQSEFQALLAIVKMERAALEESPDS
jgi:hypothetical protein